MTRYSFLMISALITITCRSQQPAAPVRFSRPLDIPVSLAGNFMELRSDHFHSGLDLRTDNREGLPVKAAADGWVSRIKVSPWGYGKALYIDHPNGYTTVYGHLRNYVGAIAKAALDAQYKAHDFEVDVTFAPGELSVKDGQVVANSGNTGGSSGPHLHFEVRRTSDQHALDPERYGVQADDTIPPALLGIRVDPLDSLARVAPYPKGARGFAVSHDGSTFTLKEPATVAAIGTVGIAVNVIDTYNLNGSTCGIRSLRLEVDGVPAFSASLDEIDFGLQRYADAYMDYALFKDADMHYNRCYKLPNNKLQVYGNEAVAGRIALEPGKDRRVKVIAQDAHGNASTLEFTLHAATKPEALAWPPAAHAGRLARYDKETILEEDGIRLTLPANALYMNEYVQLSARTKPAANAPKSALFSPVHRVHDALVPLQLPGQLSLRLNDGYPKDQAGKLLVVKLADKGAPSPIGGSVKEGWITAKVKGFGDYTVMLDTTPPTIVPLGAGGKKAAPADSLRFRVGDDLSGIEQWSGTMDGQWILFEYDPKKKLLFHRFDDRSDKPGTHTLELKVRDERGNQRVHTTTFSR